MNYPLKIFDYISQSSNVGFSPTPGNLLLRRWRWQGSQRWYHGWNFWSSDPRLRQPRTWRSPHRWWWYHGCRVAACHASCNWGWWESFDWVAGRCNGEKKNKGKRREDWESGTQDLWWASCLAFQNQQLRIFVLKPCSPPSLGTSNSQDSQVKFLSKIHVPIYVYI